MFSRTLAAAAGLLIATSTIVALCGHGHHHRQTVCTCCQACPATCQVKVCRVKEEVVKVPKTKYSCECEDFCIPGQSTLCGTECDCSSGCAKCKKIWKPGCGEVRTRLVLKKSKEEVEVVKYTWEVVDACGDCAAKLEQESAKNAKDEKKKGDKKKKDKKKKESPDNERDGKGEQKETDKVKDEKKAAEKPSARAPGRQGVAGDESARPQRAVKQPNLFFVRS